MPINIGPDGKVKDINRAALQKTNIPAVTDASVADVSGIFKKAAGAVVSTAFPTVDAAAPPAKFGGMSPEEARQRQIKFAGVKQYPADMKYFAMFKFSAYRRIDLKTNQQKLPTINIMLPMPANLVDQYNVNYSEVQLGIGGANMSQAAKDIIGAAQGGEGFFGAIGNAASEIANKTANVGVGDTLTDAAIIGTRQIVAGTSQALGAAVSTVTGTQQNPHLATIFRDMSMKKHSFSYTFSPNSLAELNTLKEIIKQFRLRMLPGYTSGGLEMQFTFPDVCDITFGPNDNTPYKIKRCVLESMSVDYGPNGAPSFFKTGDPVQVKIDLSFKEIEVFTREDVDVTSLTDDPTSGGAG